VSELNRLRDGNDLAARLLRPGAREQPRPALLDRALDQLPPELRTAFVLFEVENLSMLEIAELLGIPRGAVASRLGPAREQFQAAARALQGGTK
jgi:DNA-directed RNA polymerase specialized sigma24 family protein